MKWNDERLRWLGLIGDEKENKAKENKAKEKRKKLSTVITMRNQPSRAAKKSNGAINSSSVNASDCDDHDKDDDASDSSSDKDSDEESEASLDGAESSDDELDDGFVLEDDEQEQKTSTTGNCLG